MNDKFVIDENVLKNAWHGKKPDKTDALAEQKFIRDVFYGSQKIIISEKIRSKISKFSKQAEKVTKNVDNLVLPLFLKLMTDSQRTQYHAPAKTNFKGVKKCDKEFVGVAIKSGATLVTADTKLRAAIKNDSKITNCDCKTVEEIIEEGQN